MAPIPVLVGIVLVLEANYISTEDINVLLVNLIKALFCAIGGTETRSDYQYNMVK